MVGQSCCAVVYDSDISFNNPPPDGNLQGSTLGIIHFTVLAVGPDPEGSVLPDITIIIGDPAGCQLPAALANATSLTPSRHPTNALHPPIR